MGSSPSKSINSIRAGDIATYVSSLGNNFKAYEASIRDSGITAKELALITDEELNQLLDSLCVINRLHRRKLTSVCRKQLRRFDEGECDTCSTSSSALSSASPPQRIVGTLPASLFSTTAPPLNRGSSLGCASLDSDAGSSPGLACAPTPTPPPPMPLSGQFENMCVAQSAEALSLLVIMENQKRLLNTKSRPDGPPEGKAAIVLTDVQGSTALWEADPVAMRTALQMHDDIIRVIRADNGGYEIDTEGDAFFMAFHCAKDALTFAISLQDALREADWSDEILALPEACQLGNNRGLRVRIGIHMGTVTTRRNAVTGRLEYTGETMDRAREVEAIADGGQILTTRSTFQAASTAARIKDLGDGVVEVIHGEGTRSRRPSLGTGSIRSLPAINLPGMTDSENDAQSTSKRITESRRSKRRTSINKSVKSAGSDKNRRRRPKRSVSMPTAALACARSAAD